MRLYEYESKQIFEKYGLTIPSQIAVIEHTDDIDKLDLSIPFPVMVKAMVLIGGRGKAGGIKKANDIQSLKEKSSTIFDLSIHGYSIEQLLIEEAVDIAQEIYLSVTTDPETFDLVLVTSASGGVDIEQIAKTKPAEIWKKKLLDNPKELSDTIADEAVQFLLEKNSSLKAATKELKAAIKSLFFAFQDIDAKICEINPLIVTPANEVIAADAKVVLDDNSLYREAALLKSIGIDPRSKRHDVAEQTVFEERAYKIGFPYVDLLDTPSEYVKDEDKLYVGIVPGGAGYGIFSIDEVVNVGNRYFDGKVVPINFMDSGGGPSLDKVAEMFHLLMDHPATDIVITSRFGGISSCDVFIRGLILALRDRHMNDKRMLPVYGRMVGTDLAAARAYLEKAKRETPEPLADLHITVGNKKIMAEIIKDGIAYGFKVKGEKE